MDLWIKDGLSGTTTCLPKHDWSWQAIRKWSDALVSLRCQISTAGPLCPLTESGVTVVQPERRQQWRAAINNDQQWSKMTPHSSSKLFPLRWNRWSWQTAVTGYKAIRLKNKEKAFEGLNLANNFNQVTQLFIRPNSHQSSPSLKTLTLPYIQSGCFSQTLKIHYSIVLTRKTTQHIFFSALLVCLCVNHYRVKTPFKTGSVQTKI